MESARARRIDRHIAFPPGMQVLERGWLSCNSVVFADEMGGTLVDTGFHTHVEQTYTMARHAMDRHANTGFHRIVNTHLHSDHCGGNKLIAERTTCEVVVPDGYAAAVRAWDRRKLTFDLVGQECERFDYTDTVSPGDVLTLGGKEWEALAAPGHDADSMMFHCDEEGILITGDALWEDGCGAIFPTLDRASLDRDFAAAFATLALIDTLDLRIVVPGHGPPFTDAEGAVARARSRLQHLASSRGKNARHVARVLLKFHLLDVRRMRMARVIAMFREVPALLFADRDLMLDPDRFASETVDDLVRVGAAQVEGEYLFDV